MSSIVSNKNQTLSHKQNKRIKESSLFELLVWVEIHYFKTKKSKASGIVDPGLSWSHQDS